MERQSSSDLHAAMERLLLSFDEVADDNNLLHRQELRAIIDILRRSKEQQAVSKLPDDKKTALAALLPDIHQALQQCKARPPPAKSGCNPFKSRSQQGKLQEEEGGAGGGAPSTFSLEILRRQAKVIFGDDAGNAGKEEVVYYEWTTSYVDESRIYGWDEEAAEVVDALVGPRPPADQAQAENKGDDAPPVEEANSSEADEVDKQPFRTAAIVGIHGSGKTALAQKVFVHDRIKDAFPLRLWVCVGPPDHEDRPGLLYRMLDNLGLDTAKVEQIVDDSNAVKNSTDKDKSKIGVLLFILHMTLYKTGYLIVFDDIRSHARDDKPYDDWYSNLTLQPPKDGEWSDRLAYGLPKARKSAVLITCRKEDDARAMVRTGSVFRPPELGVEEGWKLFEREYNVAKEEEKKKRGGGGGDGKEGEDEMKKLYEEMKKQIVDKCLGLPVAIIEAARGLAKYDDTLPKAQPPAMASKTEAAADAQAHREDYQSA